MAAVWMRLLAETRARWRAMLGLAVLLGVMAGAATGAAAGARRTETAYPRFYERHRGYDVGFATAGHPKSEEAIAVAASLPQVRAVSRFSIYSGTVRAPSGKDATFPDVFFIGEHERFPAASFKVVAGRMSDPAATNEAMVSYAIAERLDIDPDDTVTVTIVGENGASSGELEIHVAGVFATVGGFESASGGGFPTTVSMTPAFHRRWQHVSFEGEDNIGILLRRGQADADAYVRALKAELDRRGLGDVIDGEPQLSSENTPGVQSLNRVPAVALWLLCGFIGLTTLAVFSQLLLRETQGRAEDHTVLYALGLSPGLIVATATLRSLVVIALGGALSAAVAFLLSPLTPVGLARVAEPDPGFRAEPLILVVGALVTMLLGAAVALVGAYAATRRAVRQRGDDSSAHPALLARVLQRWPLGVSARSGLQLAAEGGRGPRAVPLRTAVLGTTIAAGALSAALTFAVSLDHLVNEPRLSGFTWDAGVLPAGVEFDPASHFTNLARIEEAARDAVPSTRVWRGTVFAFASVGGIDVSAQVSDGPPPAIIDGRAPQAADEIAVDPKTLRQLGKRLGSEVPVGPTSDPSAPGPASVRMRLVGVFAVPRPAFQGPNAGQGVALTPSAYLRVNPDGEYQEAVFVDFPPGADFDRALRAFRSAVRDLAFAVVNRQQSVTVGNVERISALPMFLAATMSTLGIATLAHALTTTIRRRRRDLAILKAIGFIGRQVRAAVAWQSTGLVATAVLIGVPLGIAAGRVGWRAFASQLQVVPVPVVSGAVVAAVAAGAIGVANLIAAFPGTVAARTQPALVLRAE